MSLPRSLALLVLAQLLALGAAAQRTVIPFDNAWRFAKAPAGSGFSEPGFADAGWEAVSLPHTWNAQDGQDGGNDYFRGDGWYRKSFASEPAWSGRRVWIEFGAANRVAEVWLNGRRVGEHRGGYALFRFDLTDFLAPRGQPNLLAVRVNNTTNGLIPLAGDFTFFGGLYRPARLVVVPAAHLALGDQGSPGVYVDTELPAGAQAVAKVRVLLENNGPEATGLQLRTVLRDATGKEVVTATQPVSVGAQGATANVRLAVSAAHRWNGRTDPYLYRLTVELRRGTALLDTVEQPVGFRTFQVDAQQGFLLNGKPYSLHGVNRHQDRLNMGYAITPREHREDFALIQELGATAVRLAHYQQDDLAYSLADSMGLLVWAELCFVNEAVSPNPDFADNAVAQLRELIRQNYNHPSIFCWSLGNETTKEIVEPADVLLQRLQVVAKQEDPGRPTTYASHQSDEDPRNFRTDLLAYNKYFGWYNDDYDDFGPWLDRWHAKHPDRPLGISEYGAGASIFQHDPKAVGRARSEPPSGGWHPEEGQSEFHERYWLQMQARPWLWCTFVWNMFDFAVDGRKEGDAPGRNDKGLVTYDRRTRKDAFFWYKANWTDAPMVYLTSRRHTQRTDAVTAVKVYSNCDKVELRLNGASLGERTAADHRFIWKDVTLKPGGNRLEAIGTKGQKTVVDSCAWTLGEPEPKKTGDAKP
jgi:beta-galactosidase